MATANGRIDEKAGSVATAVTIPPLAVRCVRNYVSASRIVRVCAALGQRCYRSVSPLRAWDRSSMR